MRTSIVFAIVVLMSVPVVGAPVQKEIFGIYEQSGSGSGPFQIYRYDVTAGTFHDCGLNEPPWTNGYNTNLAMDNNRRLYYMNPNTGSQVIYQADLDSGNNLINQVPLVTLNPQIGLIDGFTIGPDQNLYMAGYGDDKIYGYDVATNPGATYTEITLLNGGGGGGGYFRSDLAFDPLSGYLVGMGYVPGSGLSVASLYQIPANIATNGVNDIYTWEFFGGNSSPWSHINLMDYLGTNPDGVAFDPTNGDLYLSGDGERFSLWDRSTASLLNYIMDAGGQDSGMGTDLAFQTVPEPSALLLLASGAVAVGWRRR
jgi:hypothetical protein